jgi:DNA-binding IclR family transcriptional regulator
VNQARIFPITRSYTLHYALILLFIFSRAQTINHKAVIQKPKLPAQPNESLINGIAVLQRVVSAGAPAGSREIARQMGMLATRVNRLLGTLAHLGLLEQDSSRKYRPGPALHILGAQSMIASRLLPAALPVLMRLRQEGGFTVALGVLWEGRVCFLFHERPWQPVEEALFRHVLWPAQYSSLGIALLAARDGEPHLVEPEPGLPISVAPNQNITDLIAFTRKNGYAVLRHTNNHVSIGVTVGTPPVAGLAVAGNLIGDEFLPEIARRLQAAAVEITQRMGEPPRPSLEGATGSS